MEKSDYVRPREPDEVWHTCDECHGWMMPLAKYEVESGTWDVHDPRDGACYNAEASVGHTILDIAWEYVAEKLRRRKLARLQKEILPTHPNSLVCPKCLEVKRRA